MFRSRAFQKTSLVSIIHKKLHQHLQRRVIAFQSHNKHLFSSYTPHVARVTFVDSSIVRHVFSLTVLKERQPMSNKKFKAIGTPPRTSFVDRRITWKMSNMPTAWHIEEPSVGYDFYLANSCDQRESPRTSRVTVPVSFHETKMLHSPKQSTTPRNTTHLKRQHTVLSSASKPTRQRLSLTRHDGPSGYNDVE